MKVRQQAKKCLPQIGDTVRAYDFYYSTNREAGEFNPECYHEGEIVAIDRPDWAKSDYYQIMVRTRIFSGREAVRYKRRQRFKHVVNGAFIDGTSKKWYSVQLICTKA